MPGPILIATLEYPPQKGGVATYLANLAHALPAGSAHVLAPPHPDSRAHDAAEPMPIYRRRMLSRWILPRWLAAFYWTHRLVLKEKPSWIVVSQLLPMGTVAWILKRFHRTPYVVIAHGMDVALALHAGGRKLALAKRVLAGASLVVANSRYTALLAESAGVPRAHIMIAHPSPSFAPPDPSDPRLVAASKEVRDHHALGAGFVLLATGRLVERKGFDTLIAAVALLRRRGRDVMLAIAGDGPDRRRLEEIAWTAGVEEQVRFLGAVEQHELPSLYAACDALAMIPRSIGPDVEGFGIVYLEAGLLGKPVIGSRSGGVPEAVLGGKTGLLVPPVDVPALADAVASLMDDAALRARLGAAGRARAEGEFAPAEQLAPLVRFLTR